MESIDNNTVTEPVISFRDAEIMNGETSVIYDLDMDVYPGDFVYIVGKVGTGKTSIIRTIIAENPLTKGKGTVCGYELNGIKDKDIPYLRRKIGVVFQDFQLLMDRSVEDNLGFVLRATGWKDTEKSTRESVRSWRMWAWRTRRTRCLTSFLAVNSRELQSQGLS